MFIPNVVKPIRLEIWWSRIKGAECECIFFSPFRLGLFGASSSPSCFLFPFSSSSSSFSSVFPPPPSYTQQLKPQIARVVVIHLVPPILVSSISRSLLYLVIPLPPTFTRQLKPQIALASHHPRSSCTRQLNPQIAVVPRNPPPTTYTRQLNPPIALGSRDPPPLTCTRQLNPRSLQCPVIPLLPPIPDSSIPR